MNKHIADNKMYSTDTSVQTERVKQDVFMQNNHRNKTELLQSVISSNLLHSVSIQDN